MRFKDGLLAAILSFFAPGAGHVYVGQPVRFVAVFAFYVLAVAVLVVFEIASTFAGYAAYLSGAVAMCIFAVFDSLRIGLRTGRWTCAWYRRWLAVSAWSIAIVAVFVAWIVNREVVLNTATYRVPSSAMAPMLQPGDYVLVDTSTRSSDAAQENALVVVRNPRTGTLHIRRLKARSPSGHISVRSDSPTSPETDNELQSLTTEGITGIVTSVLWSPARSQLGIKVQ